MPCRPPLGPIVLVLPNFAGIFFAFLGSCRLVVLASLHSPAIIIATVLFDVGAVIAVNLYIDFVAGATTVVALGLVVFALSLAIRYRTSNQKHRS